MIDESDAPGLDRLPEIFASCLDRDNPRVDRPIVEGDYIHATDGSIVVRMPVPPGWDFPGPPNPAGPIAPVFEGRWEAAPVALPEVSTAPCPECQGVRLLPPPRCPACRKCPNLGIDFAYCECPRCSGDGRCSACSAMGSLADRACHACRQSGLAEGDDGVEIAPGVSIQRRYAAILRKHGAVAYLPVDLQTRGGCATSPLRFVAGGVEGLVMPLSG